MICNYSIKWSANLTKSGDRDDTVGASNCIWGWVAWGGTGKKGLAIKGRKILFFCPRKSVENMPNGRTENLQYGLSLRSREVNAEELQVVSSRNGIRYKCLDSC